MTDRLSALLAPVAPALEGARPRPLLGDAAMGTALLADSDGDECLPELAQVAPERVRRVHRAHVAAGARVLRTDSFGASRAQLAHHGLADVAGVARAAVARAREALAEARVRGLVAGVLGPDGDREQAEALGEAGADLLVVETVRTVAEARALVAISIDVAPVVVSFSPEIGGRLADGASVAEACAAVGADGFGLNCGQGVAAMAAVFAELPRGRVRFVFPSAGLPSGEPLSWPDGPSTFAAHAEAFREATVVGGCCGTTAAHLTALAEAWNAAPTAARAGDA